MAKRNENLQAQIDAGVRAALARLGIPVPTPPSALTERGDYVAFGSERHMALLGLVLVNEGDNVDGFTTFASQATGKVYRLEDEIGVLSMYPGVDPRQAAIIVLRQKINELEAGEPPISDRAPPMWQPTDNVTMVAG